MPKPARASACAFLALDVENPGPLAVTVNAAGFLLSDGRQIALTNPRTPTGEQALPAKLQPGDALAIANDIREIAGYHVTQGGIAGPFISTAAHGRFRGRIANGGRWLTTWAK